MKCPLLTCLKAKIILSFLYKIKNVHLKQILNPFALPKNLRIPFGNKT